MQVKEMKEQGDDQGAAEQMSWVDIPLCKTEEKECLFGVTKASIKSGLKAQRSFS